MGLFKKKTVTKTYDKENKKPVIKASICNGEQVAGFKDIHTGKIEEVMLIKNPADLDVPWRPSDVGRILRTFKIKKNVEVTDNGKIII